MIATSTSLPRVVLFDSDITGHHHNYLCLLIDFWKSHQLDGRLYIVAPEGFGTYMERRRSESVEFIPIPSKEVSHLESLPLYKRSFAEWDTFLKYTQDLSPTHGLLMFFDLFQLGIWLGKSAPFKVSGIYFRPNFHYTLDLRFGSSAWQKKIVLKKALQTRQLHTLFCLDHSAVAPIQQLGPNKQIKPLNDPIKWVPTDKDFKQKAKQRCQIESGRKVFLLLGHLDSRKGIEPTLKALSGLTPLEAQQVALIIAGPIQPEYRATIEAHIASSPKEVQIITIFENLNEPWMQVFCDLSDYILTLYQKHVGMGSTIIRAALSEKPILSSDYGYMGQVVKERRLGIVVDSSSPEAICGAFRKALQGQVTYDKASMRTLAAENTPEAFGEQIFKIIAPAAFAVKVHA